MIPKKIRSHFKATRKKMNGDNTLIEGMLTCCNSHEFEVRTDGCIKYDLFSGMHLFPIGEKIALDVCCRKCGKVISVFNSDQDGYGRSETKCNKNALTKSLICKKCSNNSFSIEIKYEYPDYQELLDLGITEIDNAFTWIWITLECNRCGKRYSNFVDFETE